MSRSLVVRGILILLVVGIAAFSAYPLDKKIKLGLDLRGGMHLVLRVQTEDALRSELDKDMERLIKLAGEGGIEGLTGRTVDKTSFAVSGASTDQVGDLADLAGKNLFTTQGAAAYEMRRESGDAVFSMVPVHVNNLEQMAVRQAVETIRNRIDAFGVAEPVIQPISGTDRILVQLPGVDDPERVRDLIKRTAFLEFRLTDFPRAGGSGTSREAILEHYGGSLPDGVEIMEAANRAPGGQPLYFAVERKRVVTGRDLKTARPSAGQFNQPVVSFTLTPEGGRLFGEATGANVGRGLAIVLDGKVASAPVINSRITDSGVIEGRFTQREVEDLAMVLRTGALPAGITYLEERTVGPSLGRDSIRQGLRAGVIGLALVILIMLVVYKLAGINAIVALVLDMVLVFGALAYFGATLTLPGIAGIILTIGMAVDANVLIFERIREELHAGRTVRSAIDAGFGKALSSIIDANVTTLIAALFLFQFGTGPIRGFAVTLSVGILASVFTAVIVSRWIFDVILSRRERVERLSI
jgi:preprotein translocase subunit SecD